VIRSTWIWKGDSTDSRHPLRAFFLAPLLSAVPALVFLAFWISGGGARNQVGAGSFLVLGYALLVSYGFTLIYGLPVFLGLSRLGCAGLLPTLLMGVLPGALFSIGRSQSDAALLVWMAVVCGFFVSGLFWFIARRE